MVEAAEMVEARVDDEEGVGVAYFLWRAERKLKGGSEGREGRMKDAGWGDGERPYNVFVRIWDGARVACGRLFFLKKIYRT